MLEDGCSAHLLVEELTPRIAAYDLHAGPRRGGVGARIADARNVVTDRAADTGMVVRFAVLDIDHVATLLAHLAELARARWIGTSPRSATDGARECATGSTPSGTRQWRSARTRSARLPPARLLVGRAAHGAGWVMGAVGEAVDRAAARRRS